MRKTRSSFTESERHGPNLYERNIGTYTEGYARGLSDYDDAALEQYYEPEYSYNETWNYVDPSYAGNRRYLSRIQQPHQRCTKTTTSSRKSA